MRGEFLSHQAAELGSFGHEVLDLESKIQKGLWYFRVSVREYFSDMDLNQ